MDKQRIGFIGNLSLKSNLEGLKFFLNQNSFFLNKNNIEVDIIGKTPKHAKHHLRRIGSENQLILNIRGFVPKLSLFTNKWLFAIAPNRSGTGINTKIFDYLALGIPVIGYKYSYRGFEELTGKYLFDLDKKEINDIYKYYCEMSDTKYKEISNEIISIYNSKYSHKILKNNLINIFDKL